MDIRISSYTKQLKKIKTVNKFFKIKTVNKFFKIKIGPVWYMQNVYQTVSNN